MKTQWMIIGTGVAIIITYWLLITSKRPYRKRDLQHNIDMIIDPAGSRLAFKHYNECVRLINRYSLKLSDTSLGYGATLNDLWNLAHASEQRAGVREVVANQELAAHKSNPIL